MYNVNFVSAFFSKLDSLFCFKTKNHNCICILKNTSGGGQSITVHTFLEKKSQIFDRMTSSEISLAEISLSNITSSSCHNSSHFIYLFYTTFTDLY